MSCVCLRACQFVFVCGVGCMLICVGWVEVAFACMCACVRVFVCLCMRACSFVVLCVCLMAALFQRSCA